MMRKIIVVCILMFIADSANFLLLPQQMQNDEGVSADV